MSIEQYPLISVCSGVRPGYEDELTVYHNLV